ncbi:OSTA/TMEM184 family protein [Sporobolomyces salmoneus]|uniref:OSTA/TMEM184 family protein n=1 Tax=Sporobolomyces salmoneus TaxID=183962 RepID=UPI00316CAD97
MSFAVSDEVHYSKSGCPLAETLPRDPVPFFSNGDLNFKAHDVGWLVAGMFSVIATWCSVWLILKHLSFFYHPSEQRMIVRILFMPIIYAWCSFFSYYFVHQALYWQLARDCYEAIVIGSFFYLLVSYLSNPRPTAETPFPQPYKTQAERAAQLRSTVKDVHVKKWIWPLGWLKFRCAKGGSGEGESFLWLMRVLVGQYVIVRPLTTLASVIGEYTGYYCLASWSPKFVHVWSSAAITISVTIAMYVVLQLYVTLKKDLDPYSPVMKFLAVKLVVFFTFWQESSLSLLVTIGVIKNRTYWSAEDIVVGISGLLSCFEMMIFAFMHVKAFPYLPYRALASPIPLDSKVEVDDLEKSIPPQCLSFEEWSEWDRKVKQREKDQARLAKMKPPKRVGDLPILKPDGSPILQQTKKWPAFVKCLRVTDLIRELSEETKWVARGGRVEMTQELLEENRRDDHEAVVGLVRPKKGQKGAVERAERGGGGRLSLDEELRRLRESRPVSFKGTTIDKNGNRVLKRGEKHAWSNEADRERERERARETFDDDRDDEERSLSQAGWWNSMMDSLGRRRGSQLRTFEQIPRDDFDSHSSQPTRNSLRRIPRPAPSSYAPENVPFMNEDSSIPIPPAHRYDSNPAFPSKHSQQALPPRLFSALPSSSPSPQPAESPEHPRDRSRETETSQDSFAHLPQTTLRPPSFVPPAQLVSSSPPPFAHLRTSPSPNPRESIGAVKEAPEVQASQAQLSPLPSLAPPPAAFFSAGTASSISRGLPLGASPPHTHP